jgi:hypothetical protein
VRIPGQPNVYVVEFDPGATTTKFTDWVSPNLLQLSENTRCTRFRFSIIEWRRISWRAGLELELRSHHRHSRHGNTRCGPNPDLNELRELETSPENIATLNQIGQYIGNIRFTEVEKNLATFR